MTYGQKWAVYTLMAMHSKTSDGMSDLLTSVLQYNKNGIPANAATGANAVPAPVPWNQALAQAVRDQVDPTIQDADIGNLASLDGAALRNALGIAGYDPNQGPCPKGTDQKAIASALLRMTGPANQ